MSLKKFREKHGSAYDDLSDLELADKLYKNFYSDLNESDVYEKLFPNIAAERFEEDIADTSLESIDMAPAIFKPTISEIAKQAGVSINDPATSKARFGGSLG